MLYLFKINKEIKLVIPIQFVNMEDFNILEYFKIFAFDWKLFVKNIT